MEFTPWTFPALSVPDPSSSGRTMITPGNHPTSCWPEKPGVMDDIPPIASSQAYPRCQDIVHFENPTRPPCLRGGQRQWHGRSYSPSELRYTLRPISRPRRSKSHSPASDCCQRTPTMGTVMIRSRTHSQSPSSSVSSMRGETQSPPWAPGYAGP